MKILIAEDDIISAIVLRKALEDLGHEVWVEPNGERAWELMRGQQFRIIMTDWMMPKLSGLELTRNIRDRKGRPYVYIFLLTVKSSPQDRELAMASGIDDFIVKPFDPADLVTRLAVAERIIALKDNGTDPAEPDVERDESMPRMRRELGAILLSDGVITVKQLEAAMAEQLESGRRMGEILCFHGWANDEDVARAHAEQLSVEFVPNPIPMPSFEIRELIPYHIAQRYIMLPQCLITAGGPSLKGSAPSNVTEGLRVIMANPTDFEAIMIAERFTGIPIEPLISSPTALVAAIESAYRSKGVLHGPLT